MNTQEDWVKTLGDFFRDVLAFDLDISSLHFSGSAKTIMRKKLANVMVNPPELSTQQILERLVEYSKAACNIWLPLESANVRRLERQVRPKGRYAFAYPETPGPEFPGVSQNEMLLRGGVFMDTKEYLLATAFSYFRTEKFLDDGTETILSDRWYYGNIDSGMVYGFWREEYKGICLFNGDPALPVKNAGPRTALTMKV